ncbi:S1C family serine protease [Lignipirellula cremea]|uniref:Periplasmic serine endoprotease DegP n=1 Tax=Lignipirellula cremea TaxID=2528010 RepID=A0A518E363_9BACT|nr:serine protease [Lignipirellula cremea]QDU98531.1 Periplasmic serine endoprotease DegP precursor [Lignipirellula cremea]
MTSVRPTCPHCQRPLEEPQAAGAATADCARSAPVDAPSGEAAIKSSTAAEESPSVAVAVKTDRPLNESYTRFAQREKRRFGMWLRRIPTALCLIGLAAGVMYLLLREPPPTLPREELRVVPPTAVRPRGVRPPAVAAPDRTAVLRAIDQVVVCLETGRPDHPTTLGAGFVVDASGLIVTNYHVIAEATQCRVRFRSGAYYDVVGYAAVSPENDLALLQIADPPPSLETLPVREQAPDPLSTVFAIGHPHGVAFSVYSGAVSRVVATRELSESSQRFLERHLGGLFEHQWIQHTAAISEGNSGGPLLSGDGRLLGVNTWVNRQTGFSYALEAKYLEELLANRLPQMQPLEKYATKEARVAASLQRLSAGRVRRLFEEAQSMHWRPESETSYAALQELAWVVALANLPAEKLLAPGGLTDDTLAELAGLADTIEKDLRGQNWTNLATITLVNEFAASQVAKPLAGAFLFCTIERAFDGDNGARGALARLAGFDQSVFLRLDDRLEQVQPGEQCLVIGVNQNGRVVRYGDNPLRLNIAPEIAVALVIRLKK